MQDITLRALSVLSSVDLIAAEDTRVTSGLLAKHGIRSKRLVSYHKQSGPGKINVLLTALAKGSPVALVSDAGTPGVSDPGVELVDEALRRSLPVVAVPGPSSLTAALSVSGLPHKHRFEGFLPRESSKLRSLFTSQQNSEYTLVFLESPHRLLKTLELAEECLGGDWLCVVTRELTKMHEEVIRMPLAALRNQMAKRDRVRGEFTVLMAPASKAALKTGHRELKRAAKVEARVEAYRDEKKQQAGVRRSVKPLEPAVEERKQSRGQMRARPTPKREDDDDIQ
jgi:16S rRNA (cytidine1402-2'-O)-methyltransferase